MEISLYHLGAAQPLATRAWRAVLATLCFCDLTRAAMVPAGSPAAASSSVAASFVQSLDTQTRHVWQLVSEGTLLPSCSYEVGRDYQPAEGAQAASHGGELGRKRSKQGIKLSHVVSRAACCEACIRDSMCAVAVWVEASQLCWSKTPSDSAGGAVSREGRVSCRPQFLSEQTPLVIPAVVPGDLITDLQRSGLVGDPYYELNFINSSVWHLRSWSYRTTFELRRTAPPFPRGSALTLIIEGVKMGAVVTVNGVELGNATNQFLRYEIPLPGDIVRHDAANVLQLRFERGMELDGRFMGCSGGWDWAPRTETYHGQASSFSKGVVGSVFLAFSEVHVPRITYVTPLIHYRGEPPTARLADGQHSGFDVRVRIHLHAAAPTAATIRVQPSWAGGVSALKNVTLSAGGSTHTVELSAEAAAVRLWWPVGLMGEQAMYELLVTVTAISPDSGGGDAPPPATVSARRRIGFRTVALVTYNDSDPKQRAAAAHTSGSGQHGMLFRVNGVALWARGANVRARWRLIPSQFPPSHIPKPGPGPNRWCPWSSLRAGSLPEH